MDINRLDNDLITLEDGWKYFDTPKGALGAAELRQIADYLDAINKAWHDSVKEDLEALVGEYGRIIK